MPPPGPTGSLAGGTRDSIATIGRALARGSVSSAELVEAAVRRADEVDRRGPELRSLLAFDDRAADDAVALDGERRAGRLRGPLHGIPVVVKDNIETVGSTTAGSLALAGSPVEADAPAVEALRAAGAIVLAKANLSEWANFRSRSSSSGWSAVGGQGRNPHVLDRSPGGSSSGSGAAVAAGIVVAALGTETDGSIVCPASLNGVVGLKPTHGLVPTAGVVPLAPSQDCVGPIAGTVADAALLLEALAPGSLGPTGVPGPGMLTGLVVGVPRAHYTGAVAGADACLEAALGALRARGARVVDPADVPTAAELAGYEDSMVVLLHELRASLDAYLTARDRGRGVGPRSLAEVVEFNLGSTGEEVARFGQDLFADALATTGLDARAYRAALARNRARARSRGLDAALDGASADVLLTLTTGPAWPIDRERGDPQVRVSSTPAAVAGYPTLSLPVGAVGHLPVGASLVARPGGEAVLLRVAAALEDELALDLRPAFVPSAPDPAR